MHNLANQTFIVRVWWEPTERGERVWRASVTEVRTQQRHCFSSPKELLHYLSRQTTERTSC
jgi:uncharacterized protein (DUF2249 family)